MQICHDSWNGRYRQPFGAVTVGESVTLNLYAPGCAGASLRLWQEGKGETMVPMNRSAALFSATIRVPEEPCVLWYFFVVNYGEKVLCYGNNPESLGGEGRVYENSQPPSFQISVYEPFEVPFWYQNGLIYQIFPDRFARGSDSEQRMEAAMFPEGWQGSSRFAETDWNQLPYYPKNKSGDVTDWQIYGGTLNGIREKIPYLKSLGVSVIYLNPIFRSSSNHHFDTADYMNVDPSLGTNEDFKRLAEECLKNNIRIILDGVFSHTGADSLYFDKFDNYKKFITHEEDPCCCGAYLNKRSIYRSWYRFKDGSPGYDCWWGISGLPNLEELDPSYDIFVCGPNGVLENWVSLGASGFHLDVADELPDTFIRNIRDTLKESDPDNLLIGEVREDASNKYSYGKLRSYFSGEELDGTLNNPFRDNAIDYMLGKESAELFCRKMLSLKENYPAPALYSSLNLLGGLDNERILSVLGGFTPAAEDLRDAEGRFIPSGSALDLKSEQYKTAVKKLKTLSVLQYAMPGVPCIFYGDEAGLQGNKDPDNRRAFPWKKEDQELLSHYRLLGLTYKDHPALKHGSFDLAHRDNCVYVLRKDKEEVILTVINPSADKKQFSGKLSDLFKDKYKNLQFSYALELLSSAELPAQNNSLDLELPPFSAAMILLKEKAPDRLELPKAAGVLCHLSSLPDKQSAYKKDPSGIAYSGALGKRGRDFIDWLSESGFKLWQILPVNPAGGGDSPYFSPCVFAGESRFIDPDELPDDSGFEEFCSDNSYWLDDWTDYVLSAQKTALPEGNDDSSTVAKIYDIKHEQYVFFSQLSSLKQYANSKGICLIGDLPIYAAPSGADVQAHPECFQLDEDGHLLNVGGVPPDYFSETGQYWSNPLYNWTAMRKDHYEWWYQRLRLAFRYFDYVRLDHFRSFSAYYAIPEGQLPAKGSWQQGPGLGFFKEIRQRLAESDDIKGPLPVIAEDLGQLDNDVFNLIALTGLPGMNIWQFSARDMKAMSDKQIRSRVFYSGTHDNQTLVGWCRDTFPEEDAKEKARGIMRELLDSKAPWVIFQLQDILLLDDSARLNVPATVGNNWNWQCKEELPEIQISR